MENKGNTKRILVRASILPYERTNPKRATLRNTFWGNTGNLMFVYSLLRNIYSEDVQIARYSDVDENDAAWINENYDLFLLPMANAFRDNWKTTLEGYTNLIRKLKIPCVVAGVGIQAGYEPDLKRGFAFDDVSRDFAQAVLEHSQTIGVRGEITAAYLKTLGIPEDRIDVIGCPSMYLYGAELPFRPFAKPDETTKLAISRHAVHRDFLAFARHCMQDYPEHYLLVQNLEEVRLLYAGVPVTFPNGWKPANYEMTIDAPAYQQDRMRSFVTVPAWLHFMEDMDLSISSCIHGGIASILSGKPTLIFPADARVRELAEYHHMAIVPPGSYTADTSLQELCAAADFSSVLEGHRQRYERFAGFLRKNGITPQQVSLETDTAFDRRVNLKRSAAAGEVRTLYGVGPEEQIRNITSWIRWSAEKIKWCMNDIRDPEGAAAGKALLPEWIQYLNCGLENFERFSQKTEEAVSG